MSFDSHLTMNRIAEIAYDLDFSGITYTDHVDFDYPGLGDKVFDIEEYYKNLKRVQEKFAGKLEILGGVEIGMQPHLADRNWAFVEKMKPDFIIGSVHSCQRCDIYDGSFTAGKNQLQAYTAYLEEILTNIKAHTYFHVLGHLDMILRVADYPCRSFEASECKLLVQDILWELISTGRGIEVNSSGWRYGLNGPHPSFKIIKRYHDMGGTIITCGSDAHRTYSVGEDLKEAYQLVKEAGFKEMSLFVGGKEEKIVL
jgi:histidinol-phosphatase (PHP family)